LGSFSKREHIQYLIRRLAKRKTSGGSPPNINDLAIKISSRYPQSGFTLDEICAELATMVANERAARSANEDEETARPS